MTVDYFPIIHVGVGAVVAGFSFRHILLYMWNDFDAPNTVSFMTVFITMTVCAWISLAWPLVLAAVLVWKIGKSISVKSSRGETK